MVAEAGVMEHLQGSSQDELHEAVLSAGEASERLLELIRNTYCSESYRCETDLPIPLTTGQTARKGKFVYFVIGQI